MQEAQHKRTKCIKDRAKAAIKLYMSVKLHWFHLFRISKVKSVAGMRLIFYLISEDTRRTCLIKAPSTVACSWVVVLQVLEYKPTSLLHHTCPCQCSAGKSCPVESENHELIYQAKPAIKRVSHQPFQHNECHITQENNNHQGIQIQWKCIFILCCPKNNERIRAN